MLVLVRGLPGSGKSTFARWMLEQGIIEKINETDDFFMDGGKYRFDGRAIATAHDWNIARTHAYFFHNPAGRLAVANTFVHLEEMHPYRAIAQRFHVPLSIVVCSGQYKNVHGVSDLTIDQRRRQWEPIDPAWAIEEISVEQFKNTQSLWDARIAIFAPSVTKRKFTHASDVRSANP